MKPLFIFVALCFAFTVTVAAQQAPGHAPDGGTRQQMQSVVIAPIPNAPFSATVVTEWTQILPDGSKQTTWNHRLVARDSSGRVFQERRFFSPTLKNSHDTDLSLTVPPATAVLFERANR